MCPHKVELQTLSILEDSKSGDVLQSESKKPIDLGSRVQSSWIGGRGLRRE